MYSWIATVDIPVREKQMSQPTKDELRYDLKIARGRLEKGWCRDFFARDKDGDAVGANDPEAVEWDVLGAIFGGLHPAWVMEAIEKAIKSKNADADISSLSKWNDNVVKDKEEVLSVFDEAISKLEQEVK